VQRPVVIRIEVVKRRNTIAHQNAFDSYEGIVKK
jgi:hypothetical protein